MVSAKLTRRRLLGTGVGSLGLIAPPWFGAARPSEACARTEDEFYLDDLGLIVQRNCDGGDTAQREGMYWFGTWVWRHDLGLGAFGKPRGITLERVLNHLEVGQTGQFRRHPTQTQDGLNLPEKTSRDQLIPLIAAMGVHGDHARLDRLRDKISKNFYFVNKDFLLFFDEYIKRALNRELQVNGEIDRFLLDGAVTLRLNELGKKEDMDDVGDDLNLIMQLALAALPGRRGEKVKAIRARYSHDRPKNYGVYLSSYRKAFPGDLTASKELMVSRIDQGIKNAGWKPDCPNVLGALKWYFREESGGGPGMVALYKPIIEKYFAAPIATA